METSASVYHIPALLPEAINLLQIKPQGIYIDATFGGGGHSRAIMKALGEKGHLYSFDRDMDAYANRIDDNRFTFVHSNFRFIENFMRFYGVDKVDGILADLGVSFHHFDSADRGFSFRNDAPLDMRMNRLASLSAADIIERADEKELLRILTRYADLKRPLNVARVIAKAKQDNPIDSTFRLAEAARPALDPRQEKKELAQVFQALRIETNDETGDLRRFLEASARVLKPGKARSADLSFGGRQNGEKFHEDRKCRRNRRERLFRQSVISWKVITRKPVEPSQKEIEENPRSRSAKLRVAELA